MEEDRKGTGNGMATDHDIWHIPNQVMADANGCKRVRRGVKKYAMISQIFYIFAIFAGSLQDFAGIVRVRGSSPYIGVGGCMGRLMRPAIHKVGYKSGNPQCSRMSTNQKSPRICPAIHHRAGSVISISDGTSDVGKSLTEPDTDPKCCSPENQLGLPENRACVDHHDFSNVSEASGKHWFVCRQI